MPTKASLRLVNPRRKEIVKWATQPAVNRMGTDLSGATSPQSSCLGQIGLDLRASSPPTTSPSIPPGRYASPPRNRTLPHRQFHCPYAHPYASPAPSALRRFPPLPPQHAIPTISLHPAAVLPTPCSRREKSLAKKSPPTTAALRSGPPSQ